MATKPSSHLGIGLVAGSILGIAAGIFLQSPKGKKMTRDFVKKTQAMRKKIMNELKGVTNLTKEKYEKIVNHVVAYYETTSQVAKKELPEIKKCLMNEWKTIEKEMKAAGK